MLFLETGNYALETALRIAALAGRVGGKEALDTQIVGVEGHLKVIFMMLRGLSPQINIRPAGSSA